MQYPLGSGKSGPKVMQATGETKSKITLDCLSQADAGVYECVATNGGYSKAKAVSTEVDVVSFSQGRGGAACKHKMYGKGKIDPADVKPVIHQWQSTHMQLIGMDALLLCRAAGPHETYWFRGRAPKQVPIDLKSDKYHVSTTSY